MKKHLFLWFSLFLYTLVAWGQNSVQGTVFSETDNEPIIGANVMVKGTTNGTITDLEGHFALQASADAILVVSYVGYVTQEIELRGRHSLTIRLKEDTGLLDEVVVVGYGTQKKETLTGSVVSVKGDEIRKSPAPNVSSSLSGKLPGLVVNQRSGEPGRDDPTILVRGFGIFGNTSPLIIIDGVERDNMSRMNPDDIESISVLKDASAAIYRARAANGVILITTKKGEAGKTEFSFNFNTAFSSPTIKPNMLDAATYAEVYNEGDWYRKGRPETYTPIYSDEAIRKYRDGSDPVLYPNTNWLDETLKPFALQTRTSIQASGGTQAVRYMFSFGALTQGEAFYHQPVKNNQYTFRANVTADLTKNLTFGANLSAIVNNQKYTTVETWINFTNILQSSPTLVARYPNGLLAGGRLGESPLLLDQRGYRSYKKSPVYSTFTASYKVPWVKGLKFDASFNYDMNNQLEKFFNLPYYYYDYNTATEEYVKMQGTGTSTVELRDTYSRWITMLYNFRLSYDRHLGDHHVGAMIGQEQQKNTYSYGMAYRKNFISSSIDQINVGSSAAEDKDNGGSASTTARNNFFGRINYDYVSKYLVELLFRYDGSQNFPSGKRYGFFPAGSLGWRISEEAFMKDNVPFMDQLKVRFSAGQTGNDRVSAYQYLQSYSFGGNYVFGTSDSSGIYANTMPNPNITWEKSTKYDIGLDAFLWNGLLGMEVTLFKEKRTDILAARNLSIPNTLGFSALPDENIGEVDNKGFELTLSHRHTVKELFYSIEGNISYAKNKIVYMDETPNSERYQNKTGKPVNAGLFYKADGIFRTQEELDSYPHANGTQVGDIRIVDLNGDKIIDSRDQYRFDYTSTPRMVFGLTSYFRHKNADLTLFFQGQTGAYNYDNEFARLGESDPKNAFVDRAKDRWSVDNPTGKMPRADAFQPGETTFFLYDATFIRLKTLELGYTLPKSLASRLQLDDLRIYVSGFNVLTWAKEIKWTDPEISGNSLYYPQQRVFN
ncbi:MAG: TonB-dependent receptor, partial [Bacteroides sp.]|nr:TonB-dependent receptor [Bacteroides sp.]